MLATQRADGMIPVCLERHPPRRLRPRFGLPTQRKRRQHRRRAVANDVARSLRRWLHTRGNVNVFDTFVIIARAGSGRAKGYELPVLDVVPFLAIGRLFYTL